MNLFPFISLSFLFHLFKVAIPLIKNRAASVKISSDSKITDIPNTQQDESNVDINDCCGFVRGTSTTNVFQTENN